MSRNQVWWILVNGLLSLAYFIVIGAFELSEVTSAILLIIGLGWTTSIVLFLQGQHLEMKLSQIKNSARWKWQKDLASEVKTHFQPMVRTLRNRNDVVLAARELIVNGGSTPFFHTARVVFLGAAANQTLQARKEDLRQELSEDSERTPTQIYQGAVEEVMSEQVPIFRVLSLLSPEEFKTRSKEKKEQYISWLRNQIVQLKKNRNYVIFKNPRAPKWGAAGAAIYTELGFLQFTSASGHALFLKNARIARNVIQSVMDDLRHAKRDNKRAYVSTENNKFTISEQEADYGEKAPIKELSEQEARYGEKVPIEKLKEYLEEIEGPEERSGKIATKV